MIRFRRPRVVLTETFPGEWDVVCHCGELFNLPTLDKATARRVRRQARRRHDCRRYRAEMRSTACRDLTEADELDREVA